MYMYVSKNNLNGTLVVDSPFENSMVDFSSNLYVVNRVFLFNKIVKDK